MEWLKQRFIRTPLETPLEWARLFARLPWRLRYPELGEIYLEPLRFDRTLDRLLRPDSDVVDVGAHLGGVLSSVVKRAPRGRHYAFEPTPRKAQWLREKFPEVTVSEIAVSDSSGVATFFEVSNETAVSGLRPELEAVSDRVELRVRCEPLDACLPDDYRPDVLKVDVIGAELKVLRGAERIVQRSRPAILFASGREKLSRFGARPEDLYAWMSDREYVVYFFKDFLAGSAPTQQDRYLAAHDYPYQAFEFLALPRTG